MSFPGGLPIPFTNKTLPLKNRLIVNGGMKYVTRRSALNVERDNTNTFGLNANAEYEVSQNFRLSFGLGWNRVENIVKPDENYQTIEASSRLTIQF
jgi:outer membrane protein assembly factor BamA